MLGRWWERFAGSHRLAEFMPDAEAVIERRHSPVAGLLIVAIAVVVGGILAWSALTEVEQVVLASGKVEPAGRVKLINHPDGGRVAEVHVVEGQSVSAGAPLLTLDPDVVEAKLAEATVRWQVRSFDAARLGAEASGGPLRIDPELAGLRPDLVAEQQALLASRREAHASRTEALAQTIERRAGEVQTVEAELSRLRASHGLLAEQLGAIRELAEKGLYPRLRMVAVERQLSDLGGDIEKAKAGLEAAHAAHAEAISRHQALDDEWRMAVLGELAAANAERDRLAEAMRQHASTRHNLVIRAPVAGIVQGLAVTSPGQSVGSNQPLLSLVPTAGGLVIEAKVANQDIGFVHPGQPATIKVHAYDFLRYGTLSGEVERIDADAVPDPRSGDLTYGITVRTDSAALAIDRLKVSVVPGMAVDVEMLVGARTILSYLTDRIFELREAAFREG